MAKYYTLVTDVGRAKMANAQVMGEKVSFSQIALGSSETKPRENQTALGKEEWRGPISNVSLDKDNPNWIIVEAVVPSNVGGFEIAEVGVYDEEGHLIVVGNHPKTYKPKMDEGTTKDVAIRIIIEVSNSEIVELKVDPSVVIATREYVESAIELAMASIDFSTVEKQIDQHVSNADIHVTAKDKSNWNTKETPSAAQAKATKALNDAKAYMDTHISKTDNPHKVTKSQVGLSNVDNVKQASKSEFDAHVAEKATSTRLGHVMVGNGLTISPEGKLSAEDKGNSIPSGLISMWSGSIASIPDGWALCDGSNGTPNLFDRFIVGAGRTYSVGDTGGADRVSLTTSQLPSHSHGSGTLATSSAGSHSHTSGTLSTDTSGSHSHSVKYIRTDELQTGGITSVSGVNRFGSGSISTDSSGSHSHTISGSTASGGSHSHSVSGSTGSLGGNQAHENRPPYFALAYIMKL